MGQDHGYAPFRVTECQQHALLVSRPAQRLGCDYEQFVGAERFCAKAECGKRIAYRRCRLSADLLLALYKTPKFNRDGLIGDELLSDAIGDGNVEMGRVRSDVDYRADRGGAGPRTPHTAALPSGALLVHGGR